MKYLITLFLALSISTATQVFAQKHSSHENQAFFGVHSDEISRDKADLLGFDNPYGNYVTSVVQNTAAEKAGLQAFDYITGFGEYEMNRSKDLGDILRNFRTGDATTVHFIRDGKKQSIPITFGKRSDATYVDYNDEKDPHFGISADYSSDQYSKEEVGVPVKVHGSSTAEKMGMESGDVITQINGYSMIDWKDITTAIDAMTVGDNIDVDYVRDGKTMKGSAAIGSKAESRSYEVRHSSRKEYAFLGINSETISKTKASKLGFDNPYGNYVTSIVQNTAAERAGLQAFDYIYGVDAYRTGEHQSLGSILRKFEPGDQATIHLIRKGNKQTVPVTFGVRSDAEHRDKDKCEDPFFGIQNKHSTGGVDGVRVSIVSNSTAKELGMQDNDIITQINGYKILDWSDISAAINSLNVGENIEVAYLRNGRAETANGPIKSYCDTKNRTMMKSKSKDKEISIYSLGGSSSKMDLRNVEVEMEDMSQEESEKMKRSYGLDMPVVNNLRIEQLKLYPNPTMGMFSLEFELPDRGQTIIRIYNASGRSIYEYDLGNFSGTFEDNVDISQNGAGSYFLEIRQDGKSLTKKILIQKS